MVTGVHWTSLVGSATATRHLASGPGPLNDATQLQSVAALPQTLNLAVDMDVTQADSRP